MTRKQWAIRLFCLIVLTGTALAGVTLIDMSANPEGGFGAAIVRVLSYWVSLTLWIYLYFAITRTAIQKGINSTGLFVVILGLLSTLVWILSSLMQQLPLLAQAAQMLFKSYGMSVAVWGIAGGLLNVWEWTSWPRRVIRKNGVVVTPPDESIDVSREAWTDIAHKAQKYPFYARVTRVWWFPHWVPVWGNKRTLWRWTVTDMMYVQQRRDYWQFSHRGFPNHALKVYALEYDRTPQSRGYRIVIIPLTVTGKGL